MGRVSFSGGSRFCQMGRVPFSGSSRFYPMGRVPFCGSSRFWRKGRVPFEKGRLPGSPKPPILAEKCRFYPMRPLFWDSDDPEARYDNPSLRSGNPPLASTLDSGPRGA